MNKTYAGLDVQCELDEQGNISKTIVAGVAEIGNDGKIVYIHTDTLGSTVLLSGEDGTILAEYEYDPFGEVIGSTSSLQASSLQVGSSTTASSTSNTSYFLPIGRQAFTGQEYDPESELYYYNARYYSAETGRFLSRDSLKLAYLSAGRVVDVLDRNGYAYVRNNPLKYVDPTGWEENKVELMAKRVFLDIGVHTFLKITMGNPAIFGLTREITFTIGGYIKNPEELDYLEARINSPTDTTGLDPADLIGSPRVISRPGSYATNTDFILAILSVYGMYDNSNMEDYSPTASGGEYNCNSFTNSILTAAGVGGIPDDFDPKWKANPGFDVVIPSIVNYPQSNLNWFNEFNEKVLKPARRRETFEKTGSLLA